MYAYTFYLPFGNVSGGHVIIVTNERHFQTETSFKENFEIAVKELADKNLWRLKTKKRIPNIRGDYYGIVFIWQKV